MNSDSIFRIHGSRVTSRKLLQVAALGSLFSGGAPCVMAATQYFSASSAPLPWDTTTPNWGSSSGGPYASLWTNGNEAVFEGAGGIVNVASVSAGVLTVNGAGYVLSGGTVTVSGSTINANQPVTVSSVLAGTGPLVIASDQYSGPAAAVINPSLRADGPYMIGNVFSLDNDVTVNALGVYAGGATSGTLARASRAGVWNSGGTELASVTVPVGAPVSADGFAYATISPVALPAGTGYTMGAQAGSVTFNNFVDIASGATFQPLAGLGMNLTSAVFKTAGATFGRPTSAGGLDAGRWGAANLKISVNGIVGLPNQPVTFSGLNTYSGLTDISGSLIYGCPSPQTWSGEIGGPGSLTQSGAGTLTLDGFNTYTGTTTVDAGCTLVIGGAGVLGSGGYSSGITNNGTLDFNTTAEQFLSGVIGGTGALIQRGSGLLSIGGAAHNYTGNTNVNAGVLELVGTSQINNSHIITIASGATLRLSGTGNNQLQQGLFPAPPETSALVIHGILDATTASAAHTIYCTNIVLNGGTMTGATSSTPFGMYFFRDSRTITANGTGNVISCGNIGIRTSDGVIATLTLDTPLAGDELTASNAFIDTGGTGAMLVKTGAGTVTLSGDSTYLGTTTVNGGTLDVTGSLRLQPTSNGTVNTIGGTANLVLDGFLDLDLSTTDTTSGNSWLLVDAANLTESYGDDFGISSGLGNFAETSPDSGEWTLASGGNVWTFIESTGSLSVAPGSGYQGWIDSFVSLTGDDKLVDADPDSDGVTNGIEFMTGSLPDNGSSHNAPVITRDGNRDLVVTFLRDDAAEIYEVTVEHSTTLQAPWTSMIVPNDAIAGPPAIVVDNGTSPDLITVVIAAGSDPRKFARVAIQIPAAP